MNEILYDPVYAEVFASLLSCSAMMILRILWVGGTAEGKRHMHAGTDPDGK